MNDYQLILHTNPGLSYSLYINYNIAGRGMKIHTAVKFEDGHAKLGGWWGGGEQRLDWSYFQIQFKACSQNTVGYNIPISRHETDWNIIPVGFMTGVVCLRLTIFLQELLITIKIAPMIVRSKFTMGIVFLCTAK